MEHFGNGFRQFGQLVGFGLVAKFPNFVEKLLIRPPRLDINALWTSA
jgi:hypothetical protein